MKNNNKKTTAILLVSVTLMIGAAAMTTLAPANIFLQEAYAQLQQDITIDNESPNGVHTGSISVKVEPKGEPDDTPANRVTISHELPNDRTKERVVESAPQSSGAAATGQGGQDILTFGFGDVDP